MPRYVKDPEALKEKVSEAWARHHESATKAEIRKNRELLRRQLHKTLYEPRLCMGDPGTGQECGRFALPGAGFCSHHGGTTRLMQEAARTRLLCLVEPALKVMNKAMASNDLNLAVKAAQIVLDRAGFHPHATLEVKESNQTDLSGLSTDQLRARAARLLAAMEPQQEEDDEVIDEPQAPLVKVIDHDKDSVH